MFEDVPQRGKGNNKCTQLALLPQFQLETQATDPDGSFVSTGACNLGVPGSNPDRDGYCSSWLCIYSAPNCSKAWSAAYGTVHYKEALKSFEIRVGYSPGFGFPSVAILP